jgi:putative flippase GtrA
MKMNSKLFNSIKANSFFRFALVGIINTAVGLSIIFILMNAFHLSYWLSTTIGTAIGALLSFLLNRKFTFGSSVSFQKGAPLFFIIILLAFFGSYSLGEWLAEQMTIPFPLPLSLSRKDIAVFIGACIYTLSNYFGQKFIVFRKPVKSSN